MFYSIDFYMVPHISLKHYIEKIFQKILSETFLSKSHRKTSHQPIQNISRMFYVTWVNIRKSTYA